MNPCYLGCLGGWYINLHRLSESKTSRCRHLSLLRCIFLRRGEEIEEAQAGQRQQQGQPQRAKTPQTPSCHGAESCGLEVVVRQFHPMMFFLLRMPMDDTKRWKKHAKIDGNSWYCRHRDPKATLYCRVPNMTVGSTCLKLIRYKSSSVVVFFSGHENPHYVG